MLKHGDDPTGRIGFRMDHGPPLGSRAQCPAIYSITRLCEKMNAPSEDWDRWPPELSTASADAKIQEIGDFARPTPRRRVERCRAFSPSSGSLSFFGGVPPMRDRRDSARSPPGPFVRGDKRREPAQQKSSWQGFPKPQSRPTFHRATRTPSRARRSRPQGRPWRCRPPSFYLTRHSRNRASGTLFVPLRGGSGGAVCEILTSWAPEPPWSPFAKGDEGLAGVLPRPELRARRRDPTKVESTASGTSRGTPDPRRESTGPH
jgi:hypothetical protein